MIAWVLFLLALASALLSPARQTAVNPATHESLVSLLELLPADAVSAGDSFEGTVYFYDVALHRQAAEVPAPGAAETLTVADDAASYQASPTIGQTYTWLAADYSSIADASQTIRDILGFGLANIDAAVGAGHAEHHLTLLRGRFDQEATRAAWTQSGFRWTQESGIDVARYGEDGEIDFANEVTNTVFNSAAYDVAFLPNGTLVLAATIEEMRSVIEVAVNGAPSLSDRPEIQAMLTGLPPDLTQTTIIDGSELGSNCGDAAATSATLDGLGPMPPLAVVAAGSALDESGRPVDAVLSVVFEHEVNVELGAVTIVTRLDQASSFQQRQPWTELYPDRSVEIVSGAPVVTIRLTPAVLVIDPGILLVPVPTGAEFLAYPIDLEDCSPSN